MSVTPGLWIPDSARGDLEHFRCELCGATFAEAHKEAWGRHVVACSRRHEDDLEAEVARKRDSIFTSIGDEEQHRFWRRRAAEGVNRR